MKKALQFAAVATSCLLALSVFAACGGEEEDYRESADFARICYDNLPDDGIDLPASETSVVVTKATDIKAYTSDGSKAKLEEVATYEDGVFTAKGAGIITFTRDGKEGRVEVVPAYVTNPGNQYTGTTSNAKESDGAKYLGHTHDPSFIEVTENGRPVYYLFSTGWNENPAVNNYKTYGNAIHRSEDLLTWEFVGRTFDWNARNTEFIGSDAHTWLYDGTTNGYSDADASWWAPDIVPCPSGGYWLYTCVVDGSADSADISKAEGMLIGNKKYARACILLYHSDSLAAGSFKAVMGPDGKQAVLMQSSIQRGESVKDVNGIDPQIIYTPDGKMYMAYGSFGSGDYIIELDPQTGLRKDGKTWQTHETIRGYIDSNSDNDKQSEIIDPENIQELYNKTEGGVGWEHPYYGKNISRMDMEAPVIARHDNVKIFDETTELDENNEPKDVEGKTYYYSMHSYDGLEYNYQMYGGRSESPLGIFKSAGGEGIVRNDGAGNSNNQGNKYMGAFTWHNKSATSKEIDIILPGHNDLFTTSTGVNLAAYITRTISLGAGVDFVSQIHQYYLNSKGDICINPNRYSGEMMRTVTKDELLKYTEDGKFKMVFTSNQYDTNTNHTAKNVSVDVVFGEDGSIKDAAGTALGTYTMYGKCYIKIEFTKAQANGETTYYGVVSPAWLGDQNKSGFTITALGYTNPKRSMSIFFNNYSTLSGTNLVGNVQ